MRSRVKGVARSQRALMAGTFGAAALQLFAAPGAGAVTVNNDFSTGDQGWVVAQGSGGAAANPGYNPAGFIFVTDTAAESGCPAAPCNHVVFASPSIQPTLAANYGGSLSFAFAASTAPTYDGLVYLDSANNDAPELRRSFDPAPSGFGTVALPLTEPGWEYCTENPQFTCTPATDQQFRSVLSFATHVAILADVNPGIGHTYSLDNVAISEPPKPAVPAVPTPVAKAKKCKRKKGKGKKAATAKKCKKKKKRG